ncbi:MAG TPA: hypothetical protein EYH04_04855 [Archaeoglobus profundus]|nr:hypothetical protein [Archaeoglobus profundus]
MMNNQASNIKEELLRKSIHLMGLVYIPIYLLVDRIIMLILIFFLTLIAVFIDIFKNKIKWLIWLFRDYEKKGIGAHLYFCISIFIITIFFSPQACFIGVICGAAGDGIAGIIRRIWTRGASISMFLTSLILVLILDKVVVDIILQGAIISIILATIVEAKVRKIGKYYINDNLSVPLVATFTYELFVVLLNFL